VMHWLYGSWIWRPFLTIQNTGMYLRQMETAFSVPGAYNI